MFGIWRVIVLGFITLVIGMCVAGMVWFSWSVDEHYGPFATSAAMIVCVLWALAAGILVRMLWKP